MKILQHFHINGTLQRSVVNTSNQTLYRRVVRLVLPEGELNDLAIPEEPIWQRRENQSLNFFNVSAVLAKQLEKEFIEALIKDNQ